MQVRLIDESRAGRDPLLSSYRHITVMARLGFTLVTVAMLSGANGSLAQVPPPAAQAPPAKEAKPTKKVKGNPPPPAPKGGGVFVAPKPPRTFVPPGRVFVAPPDIRAVPAPPTTGGTMISFDYRGADIMNVLKMFAQASGWNITVDPALAGQVTIICPKQVKLDDAFQILQSVLLVRGFTAVRNGDVVSIVGVDKAIRTNPLVGTDFDKTGNGLLSQMSQIMTQVIPIENVDAEALAKELAPLISPGASLIGSPGNNSLIITDLPSNIQKIMKLVNVLDKVSGNTVMKTYFLKRAEAPVLAEIINSLYQKLTTRGKGGGAPPQPGQPPPPPGAPTAGGRPAVVAVADAATNSLIIVASQENQAQIARDIIMRLDDEENIALDTKVLKIKFADAQDVANLVNSVLTNMRPTGGGSSGGGGFGGRFFGGFDPFGGGGNQQQTVNSTDPFGKVTADPRTNTLYVTATASRMKKIEELIASVDVNVPTETTTFIFPLKNASAQDVAEALSQAFSTTNQNNNGGFGGFFFGGGGGGNRTNQRKQRINRRFGQSQKDNNSPFGRSANVPPGPPNAPDGDNTQEQQGGGDNGTQGSAIPQGVQGVMTPNGFVPSQGEREPGDKDTNERTRQFYYDGYGGGRSRRGLGQQRGPQYGRGRAGGYSNLLQLQNNVFVTPSPGGDSLIVTTLPENYTIVKELIEQLDTVQRQVMIEAIIAEVTLEQDEKLGMALGGAFSRILKGDNSGKARLNLPGTDFANVFDATKNGMQFSLSGTNYDLLLQALNTDNKVKVIATPRIFTTNNQEAEIEITERIPYITSQSSGVFGGSTVGQEVQFVDAGLYLNVIPSITRDGSVTIDVLQSASEFVRFEQLGTGATAGSIRAPVTNDRRTNTLVTVKDNETIAIGGLMRENTQTNISKVPLLSEVPFLGQFFRSREKVKRRVELVIFLTPRIVNSTKDARDMTQRESSNIIKILPDLRNAAPNIDPKNQNRPIKGQEKTPKPSPAPDTGEVAPDHN